MITLSPAAARVAILAKRAGTQSALAKLSGFSQSYISRIIHGSQQPGGGFMLKLSQLDGVDEQWVLFGNDDDNCAELPDPMLIAVRDLTVAVQALTVAMTDKR